MNTRGVSRRQLLTSAGLAAGVSLLAECGTSLEGSPRREKTAPCEKPGSLQPTLNGGNDWKLPGYRPDNSGDSPEISKSVAGSVLCHVSVGKWCETSGWEVGSPEMIERCRRLTAEVAAKTVELLNASLQGPCEFAGLGAEVKSCLSCHGKDLHDTVGQMRCSTCHQQLSKKHPTVPALPPKSNGNLGKAEP
jgi:hypothetical protein